VPGRGGRRGVAALALVLALAVAPGARAYETDQYSNRLTPIADAAPVLDRRTNEALHEIAESWRGGANRERFAREVYVELGGIYWVDRIERFAMKSEKVEKLPQYRWHSIFRGAPIWATRVNFFFGVGATIRIGESLVGSDKLGHFVSQGFKYFRRHLLGWSEERIARRGAYAERWIFGQLTTSVYSNADLVANWEGYRFFRSLFEDGIVDGKGAIVRFHGGRAEILRPFTWRDHVNDYWDEALNPSYVGPSLERFLERRLPELCDEFAKDPSAFVPDRGPALRERYSEIDLKPDPELRLDRVCEGERPGPAEPAGAGS